MLMFKSTLHLTPLLALILPAPGMAAGFVKDQQSFAVVTEGIDFRLWRRAAPHRRTANDGSCHAPLGIAGRSNSTAQPCIGQIVAIGVEPRIECQFSRVRPAAQAGSG